MTSIRRLAVIATLGIVVGCSATPTATPSPVASPSVQPTLAATDVPATPTSGPAGLGDHWDPVELPGDGAFSFAGVSGSSGLVLVGRVCGQPDCAVLSAAAWLSSDGSTWERATIPDGQDAVLIGAAYAGTYFAAGTRTTRGSAGVDGVTELLWRSDDGRSWSRYGSMKLGACTGGGAVGEEESCPSVGEFTVTRGGLIVQGVANPVELTRSGTYLGTDARHWTRIDPAAFGSRSSADSPVFAVFQADIPAPGANVALLAWSVSEDQSEVWATEKGTKWIRLGTIDGADLSFASDGRQILAAADSCAADCETRIWSYGAGPFAATAGPLGVINPHLAFSGGSFLLVGVDQALRAFLSPDGVAWTEAPAGPVEDCDIGDLVGGPASVVLIDDGCGHAWITRGG